ncbi:RagB/SusD family nutrient uptake outer membrane protein [Chitinophaga nivalis]|uniref:RagB/SusD family nutrient uptake outer membrane protein n=1 Tax=Chitinophaga nivalis TaxID=2991709 RepID=A0ABT3IRA0_9BACT|nr:RagB/SusD family nutrient uptake outer membrane protein [Chitinophaga nivalis]MCW3463804.1 RagB/SusD family nutrient uptake outer membrane protein [Chitinophaga nivalis]MCW3486506.1 RagB/SusD family nutrient uptake outer membrane protein [Chitinophaga nivalis]
MKTYFPYIFLLVSFICLQACQKGEINSLNTPTVDEIIKNPSKSDLYNLVTGAESGMRNNFSVYLDITGMIGRESYRFSGSEPRYTTDILGGGTKTLDNNTFYLTNPWAARYQVIRQCFIIIEATKNARPEIATEAQKKAYYGFAKTLIGYQLLLNINLTDSNGARIPVADNTQLGDIVKDPQKVYDAIIGFLDAGKADLTGADVPFPLSSGFNGFKDAAGLIKFNRAIAARVQLYRKNWTGALTALSESFYSLDGDFNTGINHVFSTNGGDQPNPLFIAPNSNGDVRLAHPSFEQDTIGGDDRLNKTSVRISPASQSGLTSNRDVIIWTSLSAPVSLIRNEELILIYAEAKLQTNAFTEAVKALDRIRAGHHLPPYKGKENATELLQDLLYQRRYSLFLEGHRWIDLRRYRLLNTLPIDRADDDVWSKFPIPQAESNI